MKKIICPVDFSENSLDAARFALRFATIADSEIKFLYVSSVLIPTGGINYGIEVESPAYHLRLRTEELDEQIDALYKEAELTRDPAKVVCQAVDYASVVHGIVETADKNRADLIIMGTKGAAGLKRIFMGSVTTAVLEEAKCPVLAIPADFHARYVEKVAMATEIANVEKEVAPAVEFARIFDARLDIFHISTRQPDDDKLVTDLKQATGYDKITYTEVIPEIEGDVNEGLHTYVKEHNPDVLVMFYTRRNWFEKLLFGSRTKNVVFQADTAVLSIKRDRSEATE